MRILGINGIGYHDASACLVEDGRVTAFVEEERFTRVKHAVLQQPVNAIKWCLDSRQLRWVDIDAIATPWIEGEFGVIADIGYDPAITFSTRELGRDPVRWPRRLTNLLAEAGCPSLQVPSLVQVSHHLAHAASAYWSSGVDDTAILVVDGEGDRVSTTLAHGRGGRIELIEQFSTVDSLGQFYACVTNFIGLGNFGEGKMMGLAPYGSPRLEFPEIRLHSDGYRIELGDGVRRWDPAGSDWRAIIRAWMASLSTRLGNPRRQRDVGRPTSLAEWPTTDLDIAASVQHVLEDVLRHLALVALRASQSRCLAVAGGVGLNCSANGALADMSEVDRLFVQPIAGDNGVGLGAALHVSALAGEYPMSEMQSVALGPAFGPDEHAAVLNGTALVHSEPDDIADAVALRLAQDQVVCWFQGALEGGPRALGQRSILASPGSAELRDRVNDIKRRARWRPLAPSLCETDAADVFVPGRRSPFMIVADTVADRWREHLPGVTHVDGSARPQTVRAEANPAYFRVIDRFRSATGLPAVINTSFNDEKEPIVCSPAEAVRTFVQSGADALALGPYLIENPDRPASRPRPSMASRRSSHDA